MFQFLLLLLLLLVHSSQGGRLTSARQAVETCPCSSSQSCNEYECICRKGQFNQGCECAFAGSHYKTYNPCDTNECCAIAGVTRRQRWRSGRLLLTSSSSPSSASTQNDNDHNAEEEYRQLVATCGMYEYEGSLFVDDTGHLYAVATKLPQQQQQQQQQQDAMMMLDDDDANSDNCPVLLVAHSVFDRTQDGDSPGEKQLLVWDDWKEAEESFFQGLHRYYMGTFALADLAQAYDAASPNNAAAGAASSVYDIVSNNCGSFLLSLAKELGIKIDRAVTGYVVQRLLKSSSQELMRSIRNAFHSSGRFLLRQRQDGREESSSSSVTDEELVKLLVEEQIMKYV